jgi:antirestriction protein ArdC
MSRTRTLTPAEKAARDEANAAKLAEVHGRLADQVSQLVKGDQWQAMLRAAARFHTYSLNNVLLIHLQFPAASRVAGYRTWQSLGRQVRRGETGIAILAPVTYKVQVEEDQDEHPEVKQLRGFKVELVFDISQTDGEPIPEVPPVLLEGDGPLDLWNSLADLVKTEGYEIRRGKCTHVTANGETDPLTHTVTVHDDLSPLQAIKTLTHELAHIRLGHVENLSTYHLCRGRCEVEAESVAFVVLLEAGYDASSYSTPYVAGWADDPKVIHETAQRVITAARGIVENMPAVDMAA